jgi:adenylate cyclase class IV
MSRKEYEYSFEVRNLEPYIEYCKNKNYLLESKIRQERIIYRNPNKTIGRITKNTNFNGIVSNELDFKDDLLSKEMLIERRESLSINFTDEVAIQSILDFLGYKKDNTLIRTRTVYKKNNVSFELDDYEQPKKTYVVAIDGLKEEVNAVYKEIANINKK